MRGIDVLGNLDLTHRIDGERTHRVGEPFERVARRGQQLSRRTRIADVVRAFTEETKPAAANVQTGAHPVSLFRRGRHRDRCRQGQMANPCEGVVDHLALDGELAWIRNVTEHAAAAERIVEWLAPIGRRFVDGDRFRERDAFRHSFDARTDLLARDRASHERDLPVDACDHPAARRGLLNREGEDLSGDEHLVPR